jgi:hypothetical protein
VVQGTAPHCFNSKGPQLATLRFTRIETCCLLTSLVNRSLALLSLLAHADRIAGAAATVQFIGIPSGNPGVTRIDFVGPEDAAPGLQPVAVTVGGMASPAANFTVVQ